MGKNKRDFFDDVDREQAFYNHSLKARILRYDSYFVSRYFYHLRMIEWLEVTPPQTLIKKMLLGWHKYRLRVYSRITGCQIPPHTLGFGVKIYHWGWMIVNTKAKIGKNLTIYPGVTVGGANTGVPKIGDNVFLGLGCKVFGGIHIGNNVIVAPNAVVVKDVPDDCVVGGVPAKIIKKR